MYQITDEKLLRVTDLLTELDVYWSLEIRKGKLARLWISNVSRSHERYHDLLSALVAFFGPLKKEFEHGHQNWLADANDISLCWYGAAKCAITGYRTETRPVKKEVETEETETVEVPIYDCSAAE